MFRKVWAYIKRASTRFGRFLAPMLKPFFRFIGVAAILASGWYAFLLLVSQPPIEPTPVLIMIWSSVLVLLFALFPRILDRVKRFKVKDFEIELQDTVARSTPEDYISFSDLDEYTFSQKGDFRNLEDILEQAIRQPSKPILLVANLRDGKYISIPMLFIYLFLLDMIGKSITVLFVSTRQSFKDIADITKDSIVGAVSGKTVLQTFYRRFPHFYRIFDIPKVSWFPIFEEFFWRGRFRGEQGESIFREAYDTLREAHSDETEFLTERDMRNWFRGELNFRTVEVSLGSQDLKTIREALAQGDEFILSIKDKGLRSVISLCYFSKDIMKKVLADIAQTK